MWKTIIETAFAAFSMALFYALIDFFISMKPIVHKYVKSKTLINVYDLLSSQAPQLVKSVALDKNVAISETRQAAATKLASLVSRNGFDVTPETINRYVNAATDAYKSEDGKFVQSSNQLAQDVLEDTYNALVAKNNATNPSQAPAPSDQVNGSDFNGK